MDRQEQIIKKKIDDVYLEEHNEEFRIAERRYKAYMKYKDDIKLYCQAKGIKEMNGNNYKVIYQTRPGTRVDNSLLDPVEKEKARVPCETWLGYYHNQ